MDVISVRLTSATPSKDGIRRAPKHRAKAGLQTPEKRIDQLRGVRLGSDPEECSRQVATAGHHAPIAINEAIHHEAQGHVQLLMADMLHAFGHGVQIAFAQCVEHRVLFWKYCRIVPIDTPARFATCVVVKAAGLVAVKS